MPQININQKLDELLATKFETEVIEFKEAKNDFSFEELGKYFSALSNEANLHNVECAWLVFGVEDKKHKVVGTNYRLDDKSLNNLKEEIASILQAIFHLLKFTSVQEKTKMVMINVFLFFRFLLLQKEFQPHSKESTMVVMVKL